MNVTNTIRQAGSEAGNAPGSPALVQAEAIAAAAVAVATTA